MQCRRWQSEVIRGNQRSSEAIRGHQSSSEAISGDPRGNQSWQSSAIGCNHAPLPFDGPLLQLPLLLLLLCARCLRLADECLML